MTTEQIQAWVERNALLACDQCRDVLPWYYMS